MDSDSGVWQYVSAISLAVNILLGWGCYRLNRRAYEERISANLVFGPDAPDDGSLPKVRLRLECPNKIGVQCVRLTWNKGEDDVQLERDTREPNCVLDKDTPEVEYYFPDIAPIDLESVLSHNHLRIEVYSSTTGKRPLHTISGRSVRNTMLECLANNDAYYRKHGYDRSVAHPTPYVWVVRREMYDSDDDW